MHFDAEFTAVFIACTTLALGAATRLFAQRTKFPYTIAMLLLGLGIGIALKNLGSDGPAALAVLARGSEITPHLIIFAFLPALIFESAFALDFYAFRKNIAAVTLLAVPAMVLSTVAVGGLMVVLTGSSWGWSMSTALVFGALISATDPVAVVAILREIGAPKRLGVLIEGESLLNDGTAIVVFTVLVGLLTSGASLDVGAAILGFLKVVIGGIGVGVLLMVVIAFWMARTFNDATSEITLTIVLAYACMLVAEGLLHVSGVMAIVVAGVWMGGPGRTRVSPEVEHFLHEFWEMLAYIANTLIFFLVGLVIAAQVVDHMTWTDVLLILCTYVGVMAIRFVLTFGFKPLIGIVGDPISTGEATAMSWGGLRGAVSLALALIVAQNPDIDPVIRQQVLLVTAGVVFLTILINGFTMGPLLAKLGFNQPPLTEQVTQLAARALVLDDVCDKIEDVSQSRDLRTVDWGEVKQELDQRRDEIEAQLAAANEQLKGLDPAERAAGYWQQALNMERQAYWSSFGKGTLGAAATTILDQEIETQLDRLSRGELTPPKSRLPRLGGMRALITRRRRSQSKSFGPMEFDGLSLIYDISRAESMAAESVIAWLDRLKGVETDALEAIEETYRGYQRGGKERLEDLRSNLPEITRAIETRLAKRIGLNFERDGYKNLKKRGAIDDGTAALALEGVEREMKRLRARPRALELPETADLCRQSALFAELDDATVKELADITAEQVVHAGEYLFREGDKGDSMFIVARGAVHVIKKVGGREVVLDVLGGGDIVGEMSLLTGTPRTATIRAATTVTLGKINRADFQRLMDNYPDVSQKIWESFSRRRFHNYIRNDPRFEQFGHDDRERWVDGRPHVTLAAGESLDTGDADYAFIVMGALDENGFERAGPLLVNLATGVRYKAAEDCRLILLPGLEHALSPRATSTQS